MLLRNACMEEAYKSYQCIEDARVYHSLCGFVQWHPEYPTLQTIKDDIEKGIGYVFSDGNDIYGYCCIIVGDEPAYHVIDGAWKTDRPLYPCHMQDAANPLEKGACRRRKSVKRHIDP